MSAQQLLKKVVDNEIAADQADNYRWMYVAENRKAGQDSKEKTVETRHGVLTMRLSVNGKALGEQQQAKQQEHIHEMVSSPQEAIRARRDQQQDADKVEDMLRLLPEALRAKYGARRDDLQALEFRPNPNFHPQLMKLRCFGRCPESFGST